MKVDQVRIEVNMLIVIAALALSQTACTKTGPEAPGAQVAAAKPPLKLVTPSFESPYKRDADGRTIIKPVTQGPKTTRVIYVSSSSGSDANDGLSPKKPMRSHVEAVRKMRPGYPDHVLLKRGDTWKGSLWLNGVTGLGPGQPALIGAYGEGPRPKIHAGRGAGVGFGPNDRHEFLAIMSLDLSAEKRKPGHPDFRKPATPQEDEKLGLGIGIDGTTSGGHLLIEDCVMSWFGSGMVVQQLEGLMGPVEIRRNVMHHIWSLGFTQGLFTWNLDALLVEDNVFDQIGYLKEAGAEGNMFSHAMYLTNMDPAQAASKEGGPANNLVVRGNLISRSDGLQVRDGGLVEGNLFFQPWIAIMCGGGNDSTIGGVLCVTRDNVILDGGNINSREKRGWGIWIKNAKKPSVVSGNILAHNVTGGFPVGISIEGTHVDDRGRPNPIRFLRVENNVIYKYGAGIFISGNPSQIRNLELYDNVVELEKETAALRQTDKGVLKRIRASGNRFFTTIEANDVMAWSAEKDVTVEEWAEEVQGPGGVYGRTPMVDGTRDLDRYAKEVAKLPSAASLIEVLHDGMSGPEKVKLRPKAVNAWVRAGYVPKDRAP